MRQVPVSIWGRRLGCLSSSHLSFRALEVQVCRCIPDQQISDVTCHTMLQGEKTITWKVFFFSLIDDSLTDLGELYRLGCCGVPSSPGAGYSTFCSSYFRSRFHLQPCPNPSNKFGRLRRRSMCAQCLPALRWERILARRLITGQHLLAQHHYG